MLYFISDTHFYHSNIVNLSAFRFEGFENRILENLEKEIKAGDILFHLGDFTWTLNDEKGFLKRWESLPCRKILILGNHDFKLKDKLLGYFDRIYPLYKIIEVEGRRFFLSHFPALDLRKKKRYLNLIGRVRELFKFSNCDLLIHGHVHRNSFNIHCGCHVFDIPCFNVNVEFTGYVPVSVYTVLKEVCLDR
ncbi:metallophosphoesterase [Desulfurobacterium atlanticum]|uniref:Calcineurin-like phosphoesterase superfamily protein n=1 Tax=Desulfurobacterium atlanticum TaxID=240169 RepID=A0A238YA11_9BACT|nr:metallophosphoesterase [Desulfurobacterium atlanticum]SNR67169.1 Calcineurin-like phosphoesterase superfamily protein [Desulfurobacterium atlanticum]